MKTRYIKHKKRVYDLLIRFSNGDDLKKISLEKFLEYGFIDIDLNLTNYGKYFIESYHLSTEERELPRFWEKVEKTETCWNWIAHKVGKGYGHFHSKGKEILAHRYSYELHKGKIAENLFVLHSCDNPSCVNPDHLWLGTKKDNRTDCESKGRAKLFGSKDAKKGEENNKTKLKESDVILIRSLKKEGKSFDELAQKFSIKKVTVRQIIHRKTWKHI